MAEATLQALSKLLKVAQAGVSPAAVLYNFVAAGNRTMNTLVDCKDLVADDLARVVDIFDGELQSDSSFVRELTQRTLAYRGKLLRPRLLLLSGLAVGDLNHDHRVLGAVVEMVHMATLVHDDVLDEADVRRSGPTVNRLAGNEAAVLLGDFLISHAYHLCSSLSTTAASRRVAAATNTICEGELMQIANRGNWALREEEYLEIVRRKTAALTGACSELGAMTSRAAPAVVRKLADFGTDLGVAFQIVDDLLDLTGSSGELGKAVGRDADMGKLTLPSIRFLQRANPSQRQRLIDALSNGRASKNEEVRATLADSDALDYAFDAARSYVSSAIRHLSSLPASDAKDALVAAAEFVVSRRQ